MIKTLIGPIASLAGQSGNASSVLVEQAGYQPSAIGHMLKAVG
jgi:hypothetical protein